MMHDNISDLLTRIRNAMRLKSEFVLVLLTNLICSILEIFKLEKFIKKFIIVKIKVTYFILIVLLYEHNQICSNLKLIKRISKPSLPIFDTKIQKKSKNFTISNLLAFSILSTSYGIMTNHTAKKLQIGGEILLQIEVIS